MRSVQPVLLARYLLLIISLFALAGCGGGSGGSSGVTAPQASSSTFTTVANTPGTGFFNATVGAGRTPTYVIIQNGARGTAVVSDQAAGEYTYTPNLNATGNDVFTFKVNDGIEDSNVAVVTVLIVKSIPIAADDIASTSEDTPVIIDVLANDNGNGHVLNPASVTLAAAPAHGIAVINADGSITYTPSPNLNGSDSFSYTVKDSAGSTSNAAMVSLSILPVNDAPVAADDNFTVLEDSTTSLMVLANNGHGADSDIDGDLLTITSVSTPSQGGSVTINEAADGLLYSPAVNFFGVETFTYTISDGQGGADVATVTVTVVPVNDPPVAKDDAFTVAMNSTGNTLSVLADNGSGADSDIDNDALAIIAVGTPVNGGVVSINVAGDALIYSPPGGFVGLNSFSYTVSDGHGGFGTAVVSVHSEFTDDFSGGNGNWTIVNDSGIASSWAIINNALHQQNGVESVTAFDQSYHKGTYAYFTAGTTLTNYRFSVDATYLSTGQADDIGVMFRYINNNNYYRLSLNSRYGFTRLEKKVAGAFTTLAVNARGYNAGQLLHLVVEVNGNRILVWQNDVPLFAVQDSSLTTGSVALYTQDRASFDNVRIEAPSTIPAVVLGSPPADTIVTTDILAVTAIAGNVPSGGRVDFLLDGSATIVSATPPYNAVFSGVSQGDHVVEAVLRNASDVELARDTNTLIGAQGVYLISLGDSIANGEGDNYAADNQSGRILNKQGYTTNLTDLLDASQAGPAIVYNEAIGGDESADTAVIRVGSIVARHPGYNGAIVLIGTNDALAGIPSGGGCSGVACNGTFKGNMQSLINTLSAAGAAVHIATPPPIFGTSTPYVNPGAQATNTRVQQYGSVITSELTNHQIGPNFYSYFLGAGSNRFSLFADIWHPNALGHRVMAYLWHNALNPGSTVALPFVLGNLTPSTTAPYLKQNLLEAGDVYYVDQGHTLISIPPSLVDGIWIMTANNDVNNSSASYITFDIDRSSSVYIAYDAGASALPGWMSSYINTGLSVSTTDSLSPSLNLYRRNYNPGTVTLGGNMFAGANGSNSNYLAIIIPND